MTTLLLLLVALVALIAVVLFWPLRPCASRYPFFGRELTTEELDDVGLGVGHGRTKQQGAIHSERDKEAPTGSNHERSTVV